MEFTNTRYISEEEHTSLVKRCHPEYHDILLTKIGTTGIAKVIDCKKDFSIFVSVALLKIINKHLDPFFVEKGLNSPLLRQQSNRDTQGVGNKNLVLRFIKEFAFPLPPLAEQKRIVEKVDRLMALCDKLEEARKKKEERRVAMNASALDRLMNASGPEEFDSAWRRVRDNFHLLYDRPETVEKLRAAILQLAVQGKLVPQDPNDEPASLLLEKIAKEKQKLIKEGKIKKGKELPPVVDEEKPYELPKGWKWRKVENIFFVTKLAGFEYTKYISLSDSGEVPVIRAQNVKSSGIITNNLKYISLETSLALDRSALIKPAILMTFIGAGIGDTAIFNKNHRWHLAPNVAKLQPYNNDNCFIDIAYSSVFFQSPIGREEIYKHLKSTAQPSLSMKTIRDIYFPLPPLAEQKRIVAKVNRLMALCDKLESSLTTSRAKAASLATSIVHHATAQP